MSEFDEIFYIKEFLSEIESTSRSLNNNTFKQYKRVIELWRYKLLKFGIMNLTDLSLKNIRQLIQDFRRENKTATSIRNYLSVLSSFYEFLIRERVIDENPIKRVKKPKIPERRVIYLNDSEIDNFISKLYDKLIKEPKEEKKDKYQDMMIILFPISTGIRVIEQQNLNIDAIDLNDGSVRIIGKGNKERYVYIPLNDFFFMSIMNKHLEERANRIKRIINGFKRIRDKKIEKGDDSVEEIDNRIRELENNNSFFINNRGDRLSKRAIQRRVKKYREELNLSKKITPHKLRHTFASLLVRKNINLFQIKEILGHSNITTTQIYLHSSDEAIKKSMNEKKPIRYDNI